jgi:hypothetical protein
MSTTSETLTHPQLVAALAKPGAAILASLDPAKVHLLHMAYCLLPEIGELAGAVNPEDVLEEHGDIEFYLEGLYQGLNRPRFSEAFVCDHTPLCARIDDLVVAAGDLADTLKKHFFYEQDIDTRRLHDTLLILEGGLEAHRRLHGFTREQVCAANIAKLRARYEKVNGTLTYSDAAAQQRADKAAS